MKTLSNAELRLLYQRRAFLVEFPQVVRIQAQNWEDSWESLLKRVNAVREEIKHAVQDDQFDIFVSEAKVSHPSAGTYSSSKTMFNILATARELLSYVDSVLNLHVTPKSKELEQEPAKSGRVFIGHGANHLVRSRVKDFIREGCGLESLILENLPSAGLTVIEKLEKYGRTADYAILILTADDFTRDQGEARAAQNVIQELGWFQGVLGRNRTAVLRQDGVEIASNLAGIVYLPFHGDNVELTFESLRKELREAGLLSHDA